jgi:hypothetical protein
VPAPESNFEHAPPGLRRSGARPAAKLPPGVAAPGKRKGRPEGPKAYVAYTGPVAPNGDYGMLAVAMVLVGTIPLFERPVTPGGAVFAVGFIAVGFLGCVIWVRMWWAWREAWGKGRWL